MLKNDLRPVHEIEKRNELTHILKNAVMFYIGKNREKRKTPNLSDILFAAVEKKKREMQAARKKKANFDQVDVKGNYLTEDEFEFVGEVIEKQIKSKMNTQLIETLQKKFEILLSDIERAKNPNAVDDVKKEREDLSMKKAEFSIDSKSNIDKIYLEEENKEESKGDTKPKPKFL